MFLGESARNHPVPTDTLALVGAAGGAGTTRLALESATLLAREGRDVALLDAAYATQGLADHTPGRIDPDMTALCVDDHRLETGLVDLPIVTVPATATELALETIQALAPG